MQQRLTLGAVPLLGLLLEQRVNLGVTAVGIAASRDRKGFETGGRIPRRAAGAQNEIGELFFTPGGEESGPLYGTHLHFNPHGAQKIRDPLGIGEKGWIGGN